MKIFQKVMDALCFLYFLVLLPVVWFYMKADFGKGVTAMFAFVLFALLCAIPVSGFSVRRAKWFLLAVSLIQIPPAFLYSLGFVRGLNWKGVYYRFDPKTGLWFHAAVLLIGLILMFVGICLSRGTKHKKYLSAEKETPSA